VENDSAAKILVADDDRTALALVERLLASRGHSVVPVVNGAQALDETRKASFGLLVLDLHMGRPTGLEVITELRSSGNSVPIILMSGSFTRDHLLQAAVVAGVTCVSKPFSIPEFEAAVANLIGKEST